MSESLDMSTASVISDLSPSSPSSEYSDSPPSLPKSIIESTSLTQSQTIPPIQPRLPVFIDDTNDKPPRTRDFIVGHAKYFVKTSLQFIFKDNNLPLLINIIYHLLAARSLLLKPLKTVDRYISIPSISPTSSLPLRYQIEQTTSLAVDSFKTLGVLHFALGVLSAIALKERRQSSERSALFVLTLSSIGQTWTQFNAYWKSTGSRYTYKALQEVGSSNLFITLISAIALSKTVKRTGRLI